jgi:hypothetical protein
MDIYRLSGSTFGYTDLVEDYVSCIWTDRYSGYGDVQITALPTADNIALLSQGSYFSIPQSDRTMRITQVSKTRKNGQTLITAKGRSLEQILSWRDTDPYATGIYYLDVPTGFVICDLVKTYALVGFNAIDAIDKLVINWAYPTSDTIDYTRQPGDLYTATKELADAADYGIRVVGERNTGNLNFSIYNGVSRPSVVFSTLMDTLVDPSWLDSDEDYYNVVRVKHKKGLSTLGDIESTNLNRRVMRIDASDIDETKVNSTQFFRMVDLRAKIELRKHRKKHLFDGVLTSDIPYVYLDDYYVGDNVYLQDDNGDKRSVAVAEQVFISDAEGDRAYPTFAQA